MKIKDIHTQLPEKINLQGLYNPRKLHVGFSLGVNNSKDLAVKLEPVIQCEYNRKIILNPLNKKKINIDALTKNNFKYFNRIRERSKKTAHYIKETALSQKNNILGGNNVQKLSSMTYKEIFLHSGFFSFLFTKKFFIKLLIFLFLFSGLVFFDIYLVKYFTTSGYQTLISLSHEKKDFGKYSQIAGQKFAIAHVLILPFLWIDNNDIHNTYSLIIGGKQLTAFIDDGNQHIEDIKKILGNRELGDIMFSQLLVNNYGLLKRTERDISTIIETYSRISFSEEQYALKNKLEKFLEILNKVQYYTSTLNNNFETFLDILGHSKRKKYLIAFQNNDEIRPQGGFMGSLGIIEIFRGQVKKFEKNDVYYYEFKLKRQNYNKSISPTGLNTLTPYLGLRDSNYFINTKTSSRKISEFMTLSGYPVDGIIYINKSILSNIFSIIGDFDSKVLQEKVNTDNFSLLMSLLVESKISKKGTLGTPKTILFNFMEELKGKILSQKKHIPLIIPLLFEGIKTRDIKISLPEPRQNILLQNLSLYNEINYPDSLDFTYPVFTSIGGNKSDRYMKYSFNKVVKKNKNCSFSTSFTIQGSHTFSDVEEKKINKLSLKYGLDTSQSSKNKHRISIQGKGKNKQYVRLLLPISAQITTPHLSVQAYSKSAKIVDFYFNTPAGGSSEFIVNYNIPNNSCTLYNYTHYKQPGILRYHIDMSLFGKQHSYAGITQDFRFNE